MVNGGSQQYYLRGVTVRVFENRINNKLKSDRFNPLPGIRLMSHADSVLPTPMTLFPVDESRV